MEVLSALLVLVFVPYMVWGYASYRAKIPNGDHVPHPCKPNYIWHGVGHINPQGGGKRNPFGLDFVANGRKWNSTLCMKDSDGDGKKNGEELGDPQCIWTENSTPSRTTGITHPGICDPTNSTICQNKNSGVKEICSYEGFNCSYPLDGPDIYNITVTLEDTAVPPTETNYYCQFVELPHDKDYHIIAQVPHIVNRNVMHHLILYGCTDDSERERYSTPAPCNGMKASCLGMLAGWTLGDPGSCQSENVGTPMGNSSYKYALLEMHWNNPEKIASYRDSSGIVLYYTPKLRQYDADVMTTGQMGLVIPPGKDLYTANATVTSKCTSYYIPHTIYIDSANIHMHYLGASGTIEHFRNGVKLRNLAQDDIYQYDSPVTHTHNPVVEFKPGDELKTTCNFNSKRRTNITYYGEGTSEEMCFGFITYYPALKTPFSPVSYKSVDMCEASLPENKGMSGMAGDIGNGCNGFNFLYGHFSGHSNTKKALVEAVNTTCNNMRVGQCTDGCIAARKAFTDHPCTSGVPNEILVNIYSQSDETKTSKWQATTAVCQPPPTGVANNLIPISSLAMVVFAALTGCLLI